VRSRDQLKLGLKAYDKREWDDAYRHFSLADRVTPLEALDLERLAMSAYLCARDEEYFRALERAHHAHIDENGPARAARCAFWLGLHLMIRGDSVRRPGGSAGPTDCYVRKRMPA